MDLDDRFHPTGELVSGAYIVQAYYGFYADLIERQEPRGAVYERMLYENLEDLYER